MNKVIKGKKYNTDTAKLLAASDNGTLPNDFAYVREELYRTKSGHFFLYGYGGGNSVYGEWRGNSGGPGEKIMPFSLDDAQEWAEKNLSGNEVEEIFGKLKEGKVKITADISESAKNVLDGIKKETGESTGELLERLLKNA